MKFSLFIHMTITRHKYIVLNLKYKKIRYKLTHMTKNYSNIS